MGGHHHIKFRAIVQNIRHSGVRQTIFIVNAHMENAYQDIIFSFDTVDNSARFLKRIGHGTALKVRGIPAGNIRSHHADQGYANAVLLQNGISVRYGIPVSVIYISGKGFAVQIGDGLFDRIDPEIILMIPRYPHIIIQRVHG